MQGRSALHFGVQLAAGALVSLIAAPQANALDSRCAGAARRVGDAVILPAWCTVEVEHRDRKARLARLAQMKGMAAPPAFHDYVVAKEDLRSLLPNFPADIPVLRVVFDERVFFDFDKSEVRPEATRVLELVAESLRREPPDVALFIAGHTDAVGSDVYNAALGARRADAVAHALLDRGIGLSSAFRVSFGESMPIDTNETDEGRQHNRRVEFLFAARPEAAAVWLARQAAQTCYRGDPSAFERCRKAISVAEEVRRTSAPLLAPPRTAELPPHVARRAMDVKRRTTATGVRAEINGTGVGSQGGATGIAPGRKFVIDLGQKTVVIGMPRR